MPLFTPDTSFLKDYNEKGKYLLVWRLSLILIFLFAVAAILTFSADFYSSILYGISFSVCLFSFIFLNITHRIKTIFWIFTISASVVVTFSMQTLLGTLHYPDFIWAICTIIFAFIGLGKRAGIFFLIFHLLSAIVFFTYFINIHLSQLRPIGLGQQISILFEMGTAFFSLTYLISQYLHFQSYTEKKLLEANQELQQKHKEIILLMKEIHHRIKNNLQLIISLLRMQRNEISNEEVKIQFSDAINRVMTISNIHQKLYQNEDLKSFDLDAYIRELIDEIKSLSGNRQHIEVYIDVEVNDLGLKTIVPLGLILNELITNSFKHAFSDPENHPVIFVSIFKTPSETLSFKYNDSGNWDLHTDEQNGFGLELINLLVEQMDGKFTRKKSFYEFELKNLDLE